LPGAKWRGRNGNQTEVLFGKEDRSTDTGVTLIGRYRRKGREGEKRGGLGAIFLGGKAVREMEKKERRFGLVQFDGSGDEYGGGGGEGELGRRKQREKK